MSTKLKGEAIKEKSILFNALSDEITDCMIPVVGTTSMIKLNKFKELLNTNTDFSCIIEFPDICIIGKAIQIDEDYYEIHGVVYDGDEDIIGLPIILGKDGQRLIDVLELKLELFDSDIELTYIKSNNESSINDPIVSKYLLNPLVINPNITIPEELIEDEQLKYTYRGMYSSVAYISNHSSDDGDQHDDVTLVIGIDADGIDTEQGRITLVNDSGVYTFSYEFG